MYATEIQQSAKSRGPQVEPLWPKCEVRDLLLWKDVYIVPDLKSNMAPNNLIGNGNGNGAPSSSSSDAAIDSGASSSRDGSESGGERRQDIGLVRDELVKLQV